VRAREKKGRSCPAHTEEKGGKRGCSCLAFARAGLGYIYRVQDNETVYATQGNKRTARGETKGVEVLPATSRTASYARRGPVIRERAKMNVMSRCDSERRVEGSGVGRSPMTEVLTGN